MIGRIPVRLRAVVAGFVLVAAPAGHGQETPGRSPVTPDPIAAAKKEIDAIKAGRDAALMPKGGVPRFTAPEFAVPAPMVSIGGRVRTPPPDAKATNWLVEAMEKQSNARDPRGRGSRVRERPEAFTLVDRKAGAEQQDEVDSPKSSEDRRPGETPPVENPLTRYLGDWMTPQDYALLKPGLSDAFNPGTDSGNSAAFPVPELGFQVSGAEGAGLGAGAFAAPEFAAPAQRENPYLKSLRSDMAVRSLGAGATPVASTPLAVQPLQPSALPSTFLPPPKAAPQTTVPDFAKPLTEEKYFRQLNRF